MSALPRTVDLDGTQQQIIARLGRVSLRMRNLRRQERSRLRVALKELEQERLRLRAKLKEIGQRDDARVQQITEGVARFSGVRVLEMISTSRRSRITFARYLAMYLARQAGVTYPRIGAFFGRDHSTVIHACQQIERRMAAQPAFAKIVRDWGKQVE